VLWLAGNGLCAAGMIGSAVAPSLVVAAGTFALTGAANALILSPEIRLFQQLVPGGVLGRVLGFRETATNTAMLAAFLSAGALLSLFNTRAVFAIGGVALLALTVVALFTFKLEPRRQRETTTDGPQVVGAPVVGVPVVGVPVVGVPVVGVPVVGVPVGQMAGAELVAGAA
jgi:hypothetical protein